tara:strand:- start:1546 stop:2163 length:618 start_codon:yes stop_codon:yes gene_type:complete
VTYHNGEEEKIEWKNPDIKNIVEANEELNNYIKEILHFAISFADDTGGNYGLNTTIKNNKFGFSIWSGYTNDMIDGFEPEGYADSHVFYTDDFINKLKSITPLRSITKDNLSKYINFEVSEGTTHYLKIFDSLNNSWIDIINEPIGDEISSLIHDLFATIYTKDEFNVINDRIYFSHDVISYFTEEQTIIQGGEFISLASVLENM